MAVTGGGGRKAPKRAAVVKAAAKRVPAHGYAQSKVNFKAGTPLTPAARRVGPVLHGNGGIFNAASNAGKAVARNIPAGIGRINMLQIKLPDLMPKANASTSGIKPRRVTTGGEGIGAGQQSFFDIGKFLNGR